MGRRVVVGLVAVTLLASACGSSRTVARATSSTYPLGPAGSPYWIAGWVPPHARLTSAVALRDRPTAMYGPVPQFPQRSGDVSLQVRTRRVEANSSVRELCRPPAVHRVVGRVRGHVSCEGPDSDEGTEYGWIIDWHETPTLEIEVYLPSPGDIPTARSMARRVANDVRPVSAATWALLVRMTTVFLAPRHNKRDAHAVAVGGGTVGGERWTLQALVPNDYPLGPDDLRPLCAEIVYRGETSEPACDELGSIGPRFANPAGQPFAFGVVAGPTRVVEVQQVDYLSGTMKGIVARNIGTVGVSPFDKRLYAAALPKSVCRAVVYDVTGGRHDRVGDANPVDANPPCQPPNFAPPTTAPH